MTDIIPMILALLLIIGLMLGVLYLMKWLTTRITGGSDRKGIKVSAAVGVGQDKSVIAVRAGSKNLLIGVTQGGISLLCELSEEDMQAIESTPQSKDIAPPVGKSFSECLKYNMKKMGSEFISPKSDKDGDDGNGSS